MILKLDPMPLEFAESEKLIGETDKLLDQARALLAKLPRELDETQHHIAASLVAIKKSRQRLRRRSVSIGRSKKGPRLV
jgi:hypothetical protein